MLSCRRDKVPRSMLINLKIFYHTFHTFTKVDVFEIRQFITIVVIIIVQLDLYVIIASTILA